jgi:hypothetical protein
MEFTYTPPGQLRAHNTQLLNTLANQQIAQQQQQQAFANLNKMNQQANLPIALDPNIQAQLQAFTTEQLLNAQLTYDAANNPHLFKDYSGLEGSATTDGSQKPGPVRRPRKKNRDDPLGMGTGTVRDEQNKQRHNASEQRRREKLNKLMDDLKVMLPECKNSKYNILDKAIQHIKTLQLQSIQWVAANKMLEEENQRLSKMLQNVKSNIQLSQSGNTVLTASGNINNINANNGAETPVNATAAATTMATLLAQSNFQPDAQSS